MAIRVLIVDDDALIRDALGELVDAEPDLRDGGRFGSIEEALAGAGARADVLLLDIHLPGVPGSIGVRDLLAHHPGAIALMLTVHDQEDRIFESICNGASGYLLKKTPAPQLVAAIREAHAGGAPMSPEIARKVVGLFRQLRPAPAPHRLTPQELRLLALLADGHSYQSTAGELGISINTVRNHVRSIYDKLHVHTKSEAVAKALKQGILK